MTTTYHSLERDGLKLVKFNNNKPTRLVDIGAHVRTTYSDITIGELWEFAKSQAKRRRRLAEAAFKKLETRLGRRPSYKDREEAPEFAEVRELPSWDSGKIVRAGKLSQKLCDWNPGASCGVPKDVIQVLAALRYKNNDQVIALFFQRE